MNRESGQSLSMDDIIKKGPAVWKIGKFGVQHDGRLVLRGYVAPFRLEVYSSVSSIGKIVSLENVKRVKCCGPFDQNICLRIEFSGSISLYFTFTSERETEEWMEAIQMRSVATNRQLTMLTNLKSHVILMPNANCHFNGSFSLDLTRDAIRISDARDTTPRIVWPVHTIRFYGNRGKLFSIATTSCSETGEGVFHLDALCSKEAEFIYVCVAALVSRMLKVAAAAFWSIPPSPTSSLPDSVPMQSSVSSSFFSIGSTANSGNKDDGELLPASGFSSTSLDDNKNSSVWNNCFYLKRMGMSLEQPTKAPKIYGLSRPKHELLEALPLTPYPFDRMTCGAVLYGPSNCGKRLLVRMAAVDWSATLLCIPAKRLLRLDKEPDAGIEMLFEVAVAQAPCIVLIRHLEDILPSSSMLLSDAEVDCASRVLQKIEYAIRAKMKGVGIVGTIGNLSDVILPLPSFRWMDRKIYVPPPCLETRHLVFAKELQDLLISSDAQTECASLLAQSTSGFDFFQMMDLCRDVRRITAMDALDEESHNNRCEMKIKDMRKIKVLVQENNMCEERRVYEESGLSSARYYALLNHSQETALYVVKLMASEALSGVSHCFLRISDSSVDLLNLDPTQTIVCWPLTNIRKHTWTPLSFILEIGRNNQTKAGEFHFETIAAKTICDFLKKTLYDKKIELDRTR